MKELDRIATELINGQLVYRHERKDDNGHIAYDTYRAMRMNGVFVIFKNGTVLARYKKQIDLVGRMEKIAPTASWL